jgi:hypothetical protein
MKRILAFLLISTAASGQGINPITPPTNWLIPITDPAFANPSVFYTTPALLGSSGAFTSLNVAGGTLANGASAMTLTATQPTTPAAAQNGLNWTIASAGSASQVNRGLLFTYAGGYTGSSNTQGVNLTNNAAGTAKTVIPVAGASGSSGNMALVATTNGSPASGGANYGVVGNAINASVNVGLIGLSQAAVNSATNIGVAGSAINTGSSPVFVGGWFSLNQVTVPTTSAALIADNGSQTTAIALFANNGTAVATVNQTGGITATLTSASGTSTVCNTAGTSTLLTLVASGTACASSAMRFKDAYPIEALNLAGLDALRTDVPWSYRKDSGIYESGKIHVGLIADDVESMDSRCVVYDTDHKLLNYYDRCILTYLVADRKALKARIVALEERLR